MLTGIGPYWHDQIANAEKVFDKWEKRGHKVVKRYRDERDAIEMPRMKFNILWSNIQVLMPSLYGRQAKPEVSRRYMDQDPVGRLASTILDPEIYAPPESGNLKAKGGALRQHTRQWHGKGSSRGSRDHLRTFAYGWAQRSNEQITAYR